MHVEKYYISHELEGNTLKFLGFRTPLIYSIPFFSLHIFLFLDVKWKSLSHVWLFVTPWTIQSMEFSRSEYWSGQPFPSPGDFPNPGIKPRSPHCRQILYQLSHKGSPRILEWVAYPFSSGSSQPRNRTRVSCIACGFFTNWAIREALLFLSPGLQPKYVLLPHLCLHGLGDTDKCNAGWEPIYSTVTQLLYLACLYLSVFVLIRMLPDFKRNIVYKKWRERTFNHWKTQALLFLPKEIWKNTQSIYILDTFIIKMTLNSFAIYISETSCFDVPQNW